jgi:hypothetical protein
MLFHPVRVPQVFQKLFVQGDVSFHARLSHSLMGLIATGLGRMIDWLWGLWVSEKAALSKPLLIRSRAKHGRSLADRPISNPPATN